MRVLSFSLLGSLAATILNVEAALLAPRPPYQLDPADEVAYRSMLRDKPAGIARRSEGYHYDTTVASTSSEAPTTVSSEAPPDATSKEPAVAIYSDPPTPMSGELHHTECGPYSTKVNNIWVTIETTKYFYYMNQPEVTKVVNVPTTIYQHVTSAVTNVVEKTIVETKFSTATVTADGAVTTAVVPTTVSVPMTETITKTIVNSVYGSDVVKTEFHTVTAAGNGTVVTKTVPTTVSVPTTEVVTKTVTISSVYGSDVTKTHVHTATITANGTVITSVVPATEVVTETVTVTSAYGSDVTETRYHTATVTANGTVVTMIVPTTVNAPTTEIVTKTVVVTSVYGSDVTETQLYTTTVTADGTVMTIVVPTTVIQPTTLPGVFNTVVDKKTDSVYFTTTVREHYTSVPSPGTVTVTATTTATATITAVTTVVEVYTNVDTSVLTNEITRTNEVTETNLITHSIGYTNTVFETHRIVTTILSTVFTSYPVTLTLTPNCQNGDLGCTTSTEILWTTEFSTLTTTALVPTRITQEITNIATEVQTRPVTITPPPITVTRAETVTAPAVTVTQAQFVTADGVTITQAQTITEPPVTVTQPASTQILTVVEDVTACPAPTDSPIKIPYDPDSSYTWGCPPGYICSPRKPDSCNFWGDIPEKDYTCEPQYCIPAPKLNRTICEDGPVPQNPGYFNMNPEVFGLSFDIFEEPEVLTKTVGTHIITYTRTDQYVSQATLSQWYPLTTPVAKRSTPLMLPAPGGVKRLIAVRASISKRENTLPELCYDPCNLANLEAQNVGRVPELCESDSAFNEAHATCQFCIDSLEGTRSYDDGRAYIQSKLQSFLDYCSVDSAVPAVSQSSTSVVAEEVQASLVTSSRSPANTDTSAVPIVESTSTSRATSSTSVVAEEVQASLVTSSRSPANTDTLADPIVQSTSTSRATATSTSTVFTQTLSSSDGSFTQVPSSATSDADALFGSSADAADGSTATDASATNSQSVSDSLLGTLTSGDAGLFTATVPDSSASTSGSDTGDNVTIVPTSEVEASQTSSGTEAPTETGTSDSSLPTTSDSGDTTINGSITSGVGESTSSPTTETVSNSSTVSGSPETAAAAPSLQPSFCSILILIGVTSVLSLW